MIYATKQFWKGAAERALKTGAQFVLALLAVGVTAGGLEAETADVISAFALDWSAIGSAFIGGMFISVMTSIVSPQVVPAVESGTGKHRA